jgi:preprotein translocase subunit SecD
MFRLFRLLILVLAAFCCSANRSRGDNPPLTFAVEAVDGRTLDEKAIRAIVEVLEKRLNSRKLAGDVSPVEKNRLQIKLKDANKDEIQRVRELVETAGCLEFLITANERDHEKIRELAQKTKDRLVRDDKKNIVAEWVDVDSKKFDLAGEANRASNALITRKTDRGEAQALVVVGENPIRGDHIKHAEADFDSTGFPSVKIVMTDEGADRMQRLTNANLPESDFQRRLAIILNGRLITAPNLFSVIRSEALISGRFSEQETKSLAATLTSLRLPAPVRFSFIDNKTQPK